MLLVTIHISGKCKDTTDETRTLWLILITKCKLNVNIFQLFSPQEMFLSLSDGGVGNVTRRGGQQTLPAPHALESATGDPGLPAATKTTGSDGRERSRIRRYVSNVNLKIPNTSSIKCFLSRIPFQEMKHWGSARVRRCFGTSSCRLGLRGILNVLEMQTRRKNV